MSADPVPPGRERPAGPPAGPVAAPAQAPPSAGFTPARENPQAAILLMLCAMGVFAGATLLAKALGTGALGPALHPLQVSHGRFLFAFLIIASVVGLRRPAFTKPHLALHLGRSVFGWAGVTLMVAAAALIPLSDATAISFLNPVFAMLLAVPLLGERIGIWRAGAAAAALLGAAILLRPGAGAVAPGALVALVAAVLIAVEIIFIKRLAGRERPLQVLFFNNLIGVTVATLAVVWVWQPPAPAQWATLAAIGALLASAQGFYINAMARAEASLVVPFSYSALIFAALYDAAVFGVIPDGVSLLGAGVILAAGAVLAWREGRRPGA